MAVPISLNASLLARLDRLAPVKSIAQIGAAIGREFGYALLSEVARWPAAQLDDALAQLVASGLLIEHVPRGARTFTFKHALVQDVTYSTLLRARRQPLHALIATALESRFPETVASQPEVLARHLAEEQYAKFRVHQDRAFESDFEAEVKRIESKRPRKPKERP